MLSETAFVTSGQSWFLSTAAKISRNIYYIWLLAAHFYRQKQDLIRIVENSSVLFVVLFHLLLFKGQLHDIAILIGVYQLVEATVNAHSFVVNLKVLVDIVKNYLVAIVVRRQTEATRKQKDRQEAVTSAVAVMELFSLL